jgi:hypothetical protein
MLLSAQGLAQIGWTCLFHAPVWLPAPCVPVRIVDNVLLILMPVEVLWLPASHMQSITKRALCIDSSTLVSAVFAAPGTQ